MKKIRLIKEYILNKETIWNLKKIYNKPSCDYLYLINIKMQKKLHSKNASIQKKNKKIEKKKFVGIDFKNSSQMLKA